MQVTEHIHAVRIPFRIPAGPEQSLERFVYAYVLTGDRVYLIDAGVKASAVTILDYVESIGRCREEVRQLVLTHEHPDHIGGALPIRRATYCSVAAHVSARRWIEDVSLQFMERPVPGFQELVGGSVRLDRELRDGDVLHLGNTLNLKVHHTPGHSPGSISAVLLEDHALFSGDVILKQGDLPIYDDALTLARSLRKLEQLEGIDTLLSSWDEPRKGLEIRHAIEGSLHYLSVIHRAVHKLARTESTRNPMHRCKLVVEELGLPDFAVNRLVMKAFDSHLRAGKQLDALLSHPVSS